MQQNKFLNVRIVSDNQNTTKNRSNYKKMKKREKWVLARQRGLATKKIVEIVTRMLKNPIKESFKKISSSEGNNSGATHDQ